EVGDRPDLAQAEGAAFGDERPLHHLAVLPRAGKLEAGNAPHRVAHAADPAAGDVQDIGAEEADLRQRAAVEFFQQIPRLRSLDLIAVEVAALRLVQR